MAQILLDAVRDENDVAATRNGEQESVEELHETLSRLGIDEVSVGLFRSENC